MDSPHDTTQGTIKDEAARASERLKDQGEAMLHRMEERGSEMLNEQKERLCGEIHHYSTALRRAAESLHEDQDERVASAADRIADELESAADYLDRRPISQIYRDAEDFARRRPEWVFGGLFLAGLAFGRFLKASSKNRLAEEPGANYRTPYAQNDNLPAEPSLYAPSEPPAYAHTPTGEEAYSGVESYVRPTGGMEDRS